MSNRKLVGRVLLVIVVIALLAGGGYALYRYGYVRGVAAAGEGEIFFGHFPGGFWFPEGEFGEFGEHMHDFFDHPGALMFEHDFPTRGMRHNFDFRSSPSSRYFATRTVFSPLSLLFRFVVCVFLLWVGYRIITAIFGGKGWRLSFHQIQADAETSKEESTSSKKGK